MWQSKYDANIDQMYFVNDTDGSILFDLPSEVKNNKKTNLLTRITSKIGLYRRCSRNSNCSSNSDASSASDASETEVEVSPQTTQTTRSVGLYTLEHSDYYYTFESAMRLDDSDVSTLSSSESIQSFYEPLPTCEVYYDDVASVFYDEKSLHYTDLYDKEQERLELRLQILRELY